MILASQNLYGIIAIDNNWKINDMWNLNVLANGIAYHDGKIYLGDWKDIIVLDTKGKLLDRISGNGYDNIHTINFFHDQLLVSSTSNDRIYLDGETLFEPKNAGYRKFVYLNSAILWRDSTILISARIPRHVIFFDIDKRKVERILHLPFLSNQHHPVPYMDHFLVSDGDGIVMFDIEGKPMEKSPPMAWPRGIKVLSRTKVLCVDRQSVMEWNPVTNMINHKIDTPIDILDNTTGNDYTGGALFDLVVV